MMKATDAGLMVVNHGPEQSEWLYHVHSIGAYMHVVKQIIEVRKHPKTADD